MKWLDAAYNLFGTLTSALGVQVGWGFNNQLVNSPTWYCSILLMCYAFFYIVTYLAKRLRISPAYGYIAMVLLGCFTQVFYYTFPQIEIPFFNIYSSRGYYAFFAGVLLAMALDYFPLGKPLVGLAAFNVVVMLYLLVYQPAFVDEGRNYILSFIFYPSLVILSQTKAAARIFRFRFLGALGKISYDVFVWHFPTLMAVYVLIAYFKVTPDFSDIRLMYLFLLLAWVVGAISHYLLEKPLDRLVGSLAQKAKAAADEKRRRALADE